MEEYKPEESTNKRLPSTFHFPCMLRGGLGKMGKREKTGNSMYWVFGRA